MVTTEIVLVLLVLLLTTTMTLAHITSGRVKINKKPILVKWISINRLMRWLRSCFIDNC